MHAAAHWAVSSRSVSDRPEDAHSELPVDPDVSDVQAPPTRPLHLRPSALAWVFAGGIVGTALRYYAERAVPHDGAAWPWATFSVNLAGAFVLGLLLEALARLGDDAGWRQRARLCAGTGGCGAFTTYSAFALEVVVLGRNGHVGTGVAYACATVVAGIVAAWLGIVVAARSRSGARA